MFDVRGPVIRVRQNRDAVAHSIDLSQSLQLGGTHSRFVAGRSRVNICVLFNRRGYVAARSSVIHRVRTDVDAQPRVRADAYQHGRYAINAFGLQPPARAPLNATLADFK